MKPRRKCANCDGPIPTVTKAMRKYAGPQIDADPYCSTKCCKLAHNVKFRWAPTFSAQGYEIPAPLEHSINPRELPLPAGGPGT